jgi:hypothetical protein
VTTTVAVTPIRGRNVFDLVGLAPGVQVNPPATVQSPLNRYFDTSQFTLPPTFSFGNVSPTLHDVRAPGRRNYDLALTKSFHVREPVSVRFRAETFNLTNTLYFGGVNSVGSNPGNNLGTPTFGVITDATGERQVQFSLKFVW